MPRSLDRVKKVAQEPSRLVRRLLPNSPRFGYEWISRPDGLVTFHERGFVSADSPAALLTRHNYEAARIRKELAGVRATRSLEVGCGFGRLSPVFAEFSDDHTAVDINTDALSLARASYPHVTYQQAQAAELPFPDDSFGFVVTWTVLQHIRPELIGAAVAELQRVLEPGGLLLICEETAEPDAGAPHCWHRIPETYADLFGLPMVRHGYIEEIARVPGMVSPGQVMVFRESPG